MQNKKIYELIIILLFVSKNNQPKNINHYYMTVNSFLIFFWFQSNYETNKRYIERNIKKEYILWLYILITRIKSSNKQIGVNLEFLKKKNCILKPQLNTKIGQNKTKKQLISLSNQFSNSKKELSVQKLGKNLDRKKKYSTQNLIQLYLLSNCFVIQD